MTDWLEATGVGMSPESYLYWTRVQASLWTAADFLVVIYLTRLANLLRAGLGLSMHILPHVILALTVPFAILLPIATTETLLFRLELLVTIPHFCIILYVILRNIKHLERLLNAN